MVRAGAAGKPVDRVRRRAPDRVQSLPTAATRWQIRLRAALRAPEAASPSGFARVVRKSERGGHAALKGAGAAPPGRRFGLAGLILRGCAGNQHGGIDGAVRRLREPPADRFPQARRRARASQFGAVCCNPHNFVSELHFVSNARSRRPGIRPPRRLRRCGDETAGAGPRPHPPLMEHTCICAPPATCIPSGPCMGRRFGCPVRRSGSRVRSAGICGFRPWGGRRSGCASAG